MTIPKTQSSVEERRLTIARRIFQALAAQDANRAITLCDGNGEVVAQHDPPLSAVGGLPHVKATRREDRRIDRS
jgi:hypothetical protein